MPELNHLIRSRRLKLPTDTDAFSHTSSTPDNATVAATCISAYASASVSSATTHSGDDLECGDAVDRGRENAARGSDEISVSIVVKEAVPIAGRFLRRIAALRRGIRMIRKDTKTGSSEGNRAAAAAAAAAVGENLGDKGEAADAAKTKELRSRSSRRLATRLRDLLCWPHAATVTDDADEAADSGAAAEAKRLEGLYSVRQQQRPSATASASASSCRRGSIRAESAQALPQQQQQQQQSGGCPPERLIAAEQLTEFLERRRRRRRRQFNRVGDDQRSAASAAAASSPASPFTMSAASSTACELLLFADVIPLENHFATGGADASDTAAGADSCLTVTLRLTSARGSAAGSLGDPTEDCTSG